MSTSASPRKSLLMSVSSSITVSVRVTGSGLRRSHRALSKRNVNDSSQWGLRLFFTTHVLRICPSTVSLTKGSEDFLRPLMVKAVSHGTRFCAHFTWMSSRTTGLGGGGTALRSTSMEFLTMRLSRMSSMVLVKKSSLDRLMSEMLPIGVSLRMESRGCSLKPMRRPPMALSLMSSSWSIRCPSKSTPSASTVMLGTAGNPTSSSTFAFSLHCT
mmetsp:Transcript_24419/g.53288  ORF Transcript_24419/g.53288 Transcript_24419/m.53288 type:complete len:214 (-) Transcript_24419:433-1074(-)